MLPLQYRRETTDLLLFFKVTSSLVDSNANKYFSQVTISYNTGNSAYSNNYYMICQHRHFKSKYKKVGVLPIRIVKSNVSSVGSVQIQIKIQKGWCTVDIESKV